MSNHLASISPYCFLKLVRTSTWVSYRVAHVYGHLPFTVAVVVLLDVDVDVGVGVVDDVVVVGVGIGYVDDVVVVAVMLFLRYLVVVGGVGVDGWSICWRC